MCRRRLGSIGWGWRVSGEIKRGGGEARERETYACCPMNDLNVGPLLES